MAEQTKDQLRAEFNKIDSDGNGSLSIEELTLFSTTVTPKISDKDIQKVVFAWIFFKKSINLCVAKTDIQAHGHWW